MDRDLHGRFLPGNAIAATGGRPPKGTTLTDVLVEALEQRDQEVDRRVALASKLIDLALGGDMDAIRYVFNRVDGMPRESRRLDGHLDAAITLVPFE